MNFDSFTPNSAQAYGRYARTVAIALTVCAFALFVQPLYATTTYSYTGSNLGPDPGYTFAPFTSSDYVHGYFQVNSPLSADLPNMTDITGLVTNFWFTDGVDTFTPSTPGIADSLLVQTSSTGAIVAWSLDLDSSQGIILSCNLDFSGSDSCSPGNGWGVGGAGDEVFHVGGAVGVVEASPGSWTAPEPSVLSLVGNGLFLIVVFRRRMAR